MTVAQFEQFLSQARHPKDAKFAAQIAGFELTERAAGTQLAQWLQRYPGRRTRQALTFLAALSAFEELPVADLPRTPAPDTGTAGQMFARAVDYVAKIRPGLPNFSALRSTTRFEIGPRDEMLNEAKAVRLFGVGAEDAVYEPLGRATSTPDGGEWLYLAATSEMPVTYRDGHEVSGSEKDGAGQLAASQPLLSTTGEFGPILIVVIRDALHGKVTWSHWEPGAHDTLAVFRYSVPASESNYGLSHSESGEATYPAYHGEIAVDSVTGAILRIVIFADGSAADQSETGIALDYGPVEIAGKVYICPLRSVALSRALDSQGNGPAQLHTFVNDVTFTGYHLFRSDVRIVP